MMWLTYNIWGSIIEEMVMKVETSEMELWRMRLDELVLALGLEEEDSIMAVGALDYEEEWLRALVDDQDKLTRLDISRSMDVRTEYKEEDSMKTDDVNKELDFMEWLLDELRDMVVEDEVIAMVLSIQQCDSRMI